MPTASDTRFQEEVAELREKLKNFGTSVVRVCMFGRGGTGKSSLVNALAGKKLAKVNVVTDTTQEAETHGWNGVTITDLPGFGTKKFPAETFFSKFNVLDYDVFVCVFCDKPHELEVRFFNLVREKHKACLFVRNKKDAIMQPDLSEKEAYKTIEADLKAQLEVPPSSTDFKVYFTCTGRAPFDGVDDVANGIAATLGEVKAAKWTLSVKAHSTEFLKKKLEAAQTLASYAAATASASASASSIFPIPGVNISVDIAVILGSMHEIKKHFWIEAAGGDAAHGAATAMVSEAVNIGAREAANTLLQENLKNYMIAEAARLIPVAGAAVGAAVSYKVVKSSLNRYIAGCYERALVALQTELSKNPNPASEGPEPSQHKAKAKPPRSKSKAKSKKKK